MKRLILLLLVSASSYSFAQSPQNVEENDSLTKHFNQLLATNCLKPYPLCWWNYSEYEASWQVDTLTTDSVATTVFLDTFVLGVGPYDPGIFIPQPPPMFIDLEPWRFEGFKIAIYAPIMARSAGNSHRIFSYHESEDICLEVLQRGNQFNIKIHSLENQIISFNLQEIGKKKILGYEHISIPIAFSEGIYEWNASPAFISQKTFLLEVVGNSLSETIRVSSEDGWSEDACQVRADAMNTFNELHNIEGYQLCIQDEIF